MKIAELLEETHYYGKKWLKEKVDNKFTKNEVGRSSLKGKEIEGSSNKERSTKSYLRKRFKKGPRKALALNVGRSGIVSTSARRGKILSLMT